MLLFVESESTSRKTFTLNSLYRLQATIRGLWDNLISMYVAHSCFFFKIDVPEDPLDVIRYSEI